MQPKDLRPGLIVAVLGGLAGLVATSVFDLRVHVGLTTVTGAASYVCAAAGGAIAAYALYRGIRQFWPV